MASTECSVTPDHLGSTDYDILLLPRGSDAMECQKSAYSKDLHSTIVAAFQCCSVWLLEHSYLLQDKEYLNTVLDVTELDILGKLWVNQENSIAAENLLTLILKLVSTFPESISSLLDELDLF